MRYRTVGIAIILLALSSPRGVFASCGGTPLAGLDSTGGTDNSTAIQNAITAAYNNGGGAVVLPVGRYLVSQKLLVKRGVILCGATEGPFDVTGIDPNATTIAATLLIATSPLDPDPFLTLDDLGAGVSDILFHYRDQVAPTATAPIVYAWTVWMRAAGTKIQRCTVTNAYKFLYISVGRTIAKDLFIGAFWCGVLIDYAADAITLSNVIQSVFWDIAAGVPNPTGTPIDTWVISNGYGFIVQRADALTIHNALVFWRFAGIYLDQSPFDAKGGWGFGTDLVLDSVQYGIIARSTSLNTFQFANIIIIPAYGDHPGLTAVQYVAPTYPGEPPTVLINGGSVRGPWVFGPFQNFPSGKLVVQDVFGYTYP